MRFRGFVSRTIAAGVMLAAIAPATGRAAAPVDWVFATLTSTAAATPQPVPTGGGSSFSIGGPGGGSGASLDVSARGHSNGSGPVLLGFGVSLGGLTFVDVFDLATGGVRLRTTDQLGGIDLEVTPVGDGGFALGAGGGGSLRSLSVAVFVTNGIIDEYTVHGSGGTATTHTGSGSTVIPVAGPGTSGVAVDASVAAAGTSTYAATIPDGIIGGLVFGGCTRCTIDWSGPSGKSGSATQTNVPRAPVPLPPPPVGSGDGDFSFAGPAGAWSWSWTGLNVRTEPSPSVMGAYAPIGDLWRVFTAGGGLGGVVIGTGPSPAPSPTNDARVLGSKTKGALASTGVGSFAVAGWVLLLGAALASRRLSIR